MYLSINSFFRIASSNLRPLYHTVSYPQFASAKTGIYSHTAPVALRVDKFRYAVANREHRIHPIPIHLNSFYSIGNVFELSVFIHRKSGKGPHRHWNIMVPLGHIGTSQQTIPIASVTQSVTSIVRYIALMTPNIKYMLYMCILQPQGESALSIG